MRPRESGPWPNLPQSGSNLHPRGSFNHRARVKTNAGEIRSDNRFFTLFGHCLETTMIGPSHRARTIGGYLADALRLTVLRPAHGPHHAGPGARTLDRTCRARSRRRHDHAAARRRGDGGPAPGRRRAGSRRTGQRARSVPDRGDEPQRRAPGGAGHGWIDQPGGRGDAARGLRLRPAARAREHAVRAAGRLGFRSGRGASARNSAPARGRASGPMQQARVRTRARERRASSATPRP